MRSRTCHDRKAEYTNHLGQWVYLIPEVVISLHEANPRKIHTKLDFSDDIFALESLLGPERGLMHPSLNRDCIQILNISKNQLNEIDCLNDRSPDGRPEFRNLKILNASRNMISSVRLELDKLAQVNLSHNELLMVPSFAQVPSLQSLILSHNRIDSDITSLAGNRRLRVLDISHNKFAWKPTVFKVQLDALLQGQIEELRLWPNSFAEFFEEYQFITVISMDTLKVLDDWPIGRQLRENLNAEVARMRSFDWSQFDIRVEERQKSSVAIKDADGESVHPASVPSLADLIDKMAQSLDRPNEFIAHVYDLKRMVDCVWGVRFSEKTRLMRDSTGRNLKPGEEEELICEFIDKMRHLLGRHDSIRDVLIKCITRLMATNIETLNNSCAVFLADWVDANSTDLMRNVDDMSKSLFNELFLRFLPGVQSVKESPVECYEISYQKEVAAPRGQALEDIAETAMILKALSTFGAHGHAFYSMTVSPLRSLMLGRFLPALCRGPRSDIGDDQPTDKWSVYEDFDSHTGEDAERVEVPMSALNMCRQRCVKQGFHGYVAEAQPEDADTDLVVVYFKRQHAATLIGLRKPCPGRTLYVRPQVAKPPGTVPTTKNYAWTAWQNGLAVVAVATTDPHIAARAVHDFRLHEVVAKNLYDSEYGVIDSWLAVAPDATTAFTLLARVAHNVCNATGEAGQKAAKYFMEQKMHIQCWNRLRRRLTDGGFPVPLSTLKMSSVNSTSLTSALVDTVCCISRVVQATKQEYVDKVMSDLWECGPEVFDLFLAIIADPDIPEPLLFAASLEIMHLFVSSEVTCMKVLGNIMARTHDASILIPYLRGPRVDDNNNLKFQDLWRKCVIKYTREDSTRARMPQLFEEANVRKEFDWRRNVPALKDLEHPLMHRVLLAIIKILEVFVDKAHHDLTGKLKDVNDWIDKQGREEIFMGPANGLLSCPDYGVKVECVKCMQRVVTTNPAQILAEEMGWLLRYVTPTGLSVGKQELVVKEVIKLVALLISNEDETGRKFRHGFGKAAIRECSEILLTNARRDTPSQAEETSRVDLSLSIAELLAECSRQLSGHLRTFLRHSFLLDNMMEVLRLEDRHDHETCCAELLLNWMGRDVRSLLMPLLTGPILQLHSVNRYHVMLRLADVLEGRLDHRPDKSHTTLPTHESDWWLGDAKLADEIRMQDKEEQEDYVDQQAVFASSYGIPLLLDLGENFFQGDEIYHRAYNDADAFVKQCAVRAERVKIWWDLSAENNGADPHLASGSRGAEHHQLFADEEHARSTRQSEAFRRSLWSQIVDAHIERKASWADLFEERVRNINHMVMDHFHCNLCIYNEKCGSSQKTVASIFLEYYLANAEDHARLKADGGYKRLMEDEMFDDQIIFHGKLVSRTQFWKRGMHWKRLRQHISQHLRNDLQAFLNVAHQAHVELKKALVRKVQKQGMRFEDFNRTQEWALAAPDAVRNESDCYASFGLVDFLDAFGATIYDPLAKTEEAISRKLEYKYMGDLTRVRDAARLGIQYRTVAQMLGSLEEMVKSFTKFRTVRIKNRYRCPTNLARHMIVVNVELMVELTRFICELQLTVNDQSAADFGEPRRRKLVRRLEHALRDDCMVPQQSITPVIEFVFYQFESRAIRSGHVVQLAFTQGGMAELVGEQLALRESSKTGFQSFRIEREQGKGACRIGDIICLRNMSTGMFVDVARNGQVYCRYNESTEMAGNCFFVVEALDSADNNGGPSGLMSLFGQGGMSENRDLDSALASSVVKAADHGVAKKAHFETIVHSSANILLRAQGTSHYLTGDSPSSSFGDPNKVSANEHVSHHKAAQVARLIWRADAALGSGQEGDATSSANPKPRADAVLERKLRLLFMCTSLPAQAMFPQEGGALAKEHSSFRPKARKKSNAPDVPVVTAQRKFNNSSRAPLVIATILRCIHALVTQPSAPEIRAYAVGELLGAPGRGHPTIGRLLALVLTSMTQELAEEVSESRNPTKAVDLTAAWLPAKFLRLLAAVMRVTPLGSGLLISRMGTGAEELRLQRALQHRAERGVDDQHQLMFLDFIGAFIRDTLTPTLLKRLEAATYRPLTRHELVLLRELAVVINLFTRVFLANPMRFIVQEPEEVNSEQADGHAVAQVADEVGRESAKGRVGVLSNEQRSEVFSKLLPTSAIKVLVHAMLYAVHREAMAYQRHDGTELAAESEQKNVQLISSLANHSIHSICAVTHCCDASPATRCEYDVCEAISHAMTAGSQAVPRARMGQLMDERSTDKLRSEVQNAIHSLVSVDTRVVTIGLAFVGILPREGLIELKAAKPELQRRVVVVTSKFHLVLLSHRSLGDNAPTPSDRVRLAVESIRNLENVQSAIVNPCMRQLLGLRWQADTSGHEATEVFVFENSWRRKQFREVLGRVPQKASSGVIQFGPPEFLVRGEFMYTLEQMVTKKSFEPIVSVFFLQGIVSGADVEVLVLSMRKIAVLTMTSFLAEFARFQDYSRAKTGESVEDSDSDEDHLPRASRTAYIDEPRAMKFARRPSEPWELKRLQGIWFMAEVGSRARLHFGNAGESSESHDLFFFSDCDRQRWRQQLAAVLADAHARDTPAKRKAEEGWAVVPTEHVTLHDLQKHMKADKTSQKGGISGASYVGDDQPRR